MNRAIKFSLILASLMIGFASAGFANLIQDPTASTLDDGFIVGASVHVGDWHVSGTGQAVGASANNGAFTGIGNGNFSVNVTPDLTGHVTAFPATGSYSLTITYTEASATNLAIIVNGVTVATGVTSGQLVTFNVSNVNQSLVFAFSGSGNNNDFAITNVNLVAAASTAPEPKSMGAAVLLIGLVGCTERRRLGGLMSSVSARFGRLFS